MADSRYDLIADAEKIAALLDESEIDCVVIGAVALAAHRYVRHTLDIDLGVTADIEELKQVAIKLELEGFQTSLHLPDGEDPLGGVLDIRTSAGLIQIVSFAGKFPAVIKDAIEASNLVTRQDSTLHIAPLPHLVILKLYAGGLKSKADIVELLKRNPESKLDEIASLCQKYRIRGFQHILEELNN